MDLGTWLAQHGGMSQDTIQYLVLDRCDPTCNMARYYVLSIETSLFGDASLIREWLSSMKTSCVQWKPLRPGSSESGDAATCCEAGRGQKYREPGLVSAQDLEQLVNGFSLLETASLVLAQHVPDLGSL